MVTLTKCHINANHDYCWYHIIVGGDVTSFLFSTPIFLSYRNVSTSLNNLKARYSNGFWCWNLKSTPSFTPSQVTCISRDLIGITGSSDLVCPMWVSYLLFQFSASFSWQLMAPFLFLRLGFSKLWLLGQMWPSACFWNEVSLEHRYSHLFKYCV